MDTTQKIALIQVQVDAVDSQGDVPDYEAWSDQNEVVVRNVLGVDNPTYKKLVKVTFTPVMHYPGMGSDIFTDARRRGVEKSVSLLNAAQTEIKWFDNFSNPPAIPVSQPTTAPTATGTPATVFENKIEMVIHDDIYDHIARYIANNDYYHAVEESYKVVRHKLKELTGEEKATEAFGANGRSDKHYQSLYGKVAPADQAEGDFFVGIGYLHLSIQNLRNEKAHTPAHPLDPNLALHYISLASLAYDLITQHSNREAIQQIDSAVSDRYSSYPTASAFYRDFEDARWIKSTHLPPSLKSQSIRNELKSIWLSDVDFTQSWNHSNLMLMRLQLVAAELTTVDIENLLELPMHDSNGRRQEAGLFQFLQFISKFHPERYTDRIAEWVTAASN